MAYSAPEDIYRRVRKADTAGLTGDELRQVIAGADAIIDGMLARRYSVPFATDPSSAPPLIKKLSVDLATLDLFDRMPNPPEWIARRGEQAQNILQALAEGNMAVVDQSGSLIAERTTAQADSNVKGYTPTFGVAPSLDEAIDPDRVDDEANARD